MSFIIDNEKTVKTFGKLLYASLIKDDISICLYVNMDIHILITGVKCYVAAVISRPDVISVYFLFI